MGGATSRVVRRFHTAIGMRGLQFSICVAASIAWSWRSAAEPCPTSVEPALPDLADALGRAIERMDVRDRRQVHGHSDADHLASSAAAAVEALLAHDTRRNRLAAHRVFDTARAGGFLRETLDRLLREQGGSHAVAELVAQAVPSIRPVIIAHRGGLARNYPENTIPALEAAIREGVDGVEFDVTVTADGQIVLWHDDDPDIPTSRLRAAGLEPGMGFKPVPPSEESAARRPVHELSLEEFRSSHSYASRRAGLLRNRAVDVQIPTLDQAAAFLQNRPEVRLIVLDVKLPRNRQDVQRRFAARLMEVIAEFGLAGRVTAMSRDPDVVRNLEAALGDRIPIALDVEVSAGFRRRDSSVEFARRSGSRVASLGVSQIRFGGVYDDFLQALRRDRARIDAASRNREGGPTTLLAWTINDELELREVLAAGVDGILTDDPELLLRLLRAYFP